MARSGRAPSAAVFARRSPGLLEKEIVYCGGFEYERNSFRILMGSRRVPLFQRGSVRVHVRLTGMFAPK